MDAQQSTLESLQDETSKLDEKISPGWTSDIQEKIEMIQDKWDALTQIIEVQAQRVRPFSIAFKLSEKGNKTLNHVISLPDMQFWF